MVHIFPGSKGHNSSIDRVSHHGEAEERDDKQDEPQNMLWGQHGWEEEGAGE